MPCQLWLSEKFFTLEKNLRDTVLENLIKLRGLLALEKGTRAHSGILLITLGSQTSLRIGCGPHRPSPFLVWLALVQRSGKADTWGLFPSGLQAFFH